VDAQVGLLSWVSLRLKPGGPAVDPERAGPARGRTPAPPVADLQPTPSPYAATSATAPGHATGPAAARSGHGRLRPGREQASATAPGRSRGRAGAARTGRCRLRPGRELASVTAPGCSCGRAWCHPLEPGGSGRVGHTLHVGHSIIIFTL
jgi:hypothetical protein